MWCAPCDTVWELVGGLSFSLLTYVPYPRCVLHFAHKWERVWWGREAWPRVGKPHFLVPACTVWWWAGYLTHWESPFCSVNCMVKKLLPVLSSSWFIFFLLIKKGESILWMLIQARHLVVWQLRKHGYLFSVAWWQKWTFTTCSPL